jgi:hypothetical protein
MGAWPDYAAAIADLRRFVSDGPQDRPVKLKQVVGVVDGVNTTFTLFDDRIVPGSLTVSVDYTTVGATLVDPVLGLVVTDTPPPVGSTVRAAYYFQYFLDDELQEALDLAVGEITESDQITSIAFGFKLAALNLAGAFAYQKQAMRWAQRMSARFLLEEEPIQAENLARSNMFRDIARDLLRQGRELRDSVYTRHGRRNAPAFAVYKPAIPPVGPRR